MDGSQECVSRAISAAGGLEQLLSDVQLSPLVDRARLMDVLERAVDMAPVLSAAVLQTTLRVLLAVVSVSSVPWAAMTVRAPENGCLATCQSLSAGMMQSFVGLC